MVDPERLELPTSAFEAHCSIQLSYGSAPHFKVYLPPFFLSGNSPAEQKDTLTTATTMHHSSWPAGRGFREFANSYNCSPEF